MLLKTLTIFVFACFCQCFVTSEGEICSSSRWTLIARNVCFGARDNRYGTASVPFSGFLQGVKLVYRSGGVSCAKGIKPTPWGCANGSKNMLGVLVTDDLNRVILPKKHSGGFYQLPAATSQSRTIGLMDRQHPTYVEKGQQLKIWYGEDWSGSTETDNSGVTCADMFALFLV